MGHETEAHDEVPNASHKSEDKVDVPHVPHLLDFHDLRRPECIAFWTIMAVCFGLGFVPRKTEATVA
jgi:hypothetical protein